MSGKAKTYCATLKPRLFYGWYIVAVGILVNIAGTFEFSSTLSIFLTKGFGKFSSAAR